jgi:hypothetical protein
MTKKQVAMEEKEVELASSMEVASAMGKEASYEVGSGAAGKEETQTECEGKKRVEDVEDNHTSRN